MLKNGIWVIYGEDPAAMAQEILEASGAASLFDAGMRVGLKPNLVVSKPSRSGATTTPEVAEGAVRFLRDHGVRTIEILEGSSVGDSTRKAFRVCGYEDLARRHGLRLVDLQRDGSETVAVRGGELAVCPSVLRLDALVNLPVLKGHCQTAMSCALKNLKGCIPDAEKRRYHALGIHRPVALLNTVLRPVLTLADAIQGDPVFEEGGTPVRLDRLILGADPVLVDCYGAHLLGLDPRSVDYIMMAAELGVGSMDVESAVVTELGAESMRRTLVRDTDARDRLERRVEARQACSACYGSLLHALRRLEEEGRQDLPAGPIRIGQGFQGARGGGIGVGRCAAGFAESLAGCPPTARQILSFLQRQSRAP
jgi:uncharacterized protein (DUF362 family)